MSDTYISLGTIFLEPFSNQPYTPMPSSIKRNEMASSRSYPVEQQSFSRLNELLKFTRIFARIFKQIKNKQERIIVTINGIVWPTNFDRNFDYPKTFPIDRNAPSGTMLERDKYTDEKIKGIPMKELKTIRTYLHAFKNATREITHNTSAHFATTAYNFNYGVVLILKPVDNEEPLECNSDFQNGSIAQVFSATNLDVSDFMDDEEQSEYKDALASDENYFLGTNYMFDGDRILIIKQNDYSEWTDEAAKQDAEKLANEISPAIV